MPIRITSNNFFPKWRNLLAEQLVDAKRRHSLGKSFLDEVYDKSQGRFMDNLLYLFFQDLLCSHHLT
jgi:hypothetical protein